jgi:hypothetical protein
MHLSKPFVTSLLKWKCIKYIKSWPVNISDTPPSSLLDPKWVQLCGKTEVTRTWCRSQLPALKGGWEGCAESYRIKLGRGTLLTYSVLHPKPTTSWLELILQPFGVGISHGQPWTHLTHHGPHSGEATTFPHIVFSALLHRALARMALCLGTPKVESRNCFETVSVWTPGTLGVHNFSLWPPIGIRSEANL